MDNLLRGNHIAVRILLVLTFAGLFGLCIYIAVEHDLTQRENALMGVLLAIFSFGLSWLLSHYYSESSYKAALQEVKASYGENLRTYALKAAEKVNNLSNELGRLSGYLQESVEHEYSHDTEELNALRERVESTIHLIHTLKSMNDTALSDWRGVIGEEISSQLEAREEREEELKDIVTRVSELEKNNEMEILAGNHHLDAQFEEIKRDLRAALREIGAPGIPKKPRKDRTETFRTPCPICSSELQVKHRHGRKTVKSVSCDSCGSRFICRFSSDDVSLSLRQSVNEVFPCVNCRTNLHALIDNFPGSAMDVTCESCRHVNRAVRTDELLKVTLAQSQPTEPKSISEEILKLVEEKMPPQPWPKDAHKEVAVTIGQSPAVVRRHIQELIRQGRFNVQLDGKVYVPVTSFKK